MGAKGWGCADGRGYARGCGRGVGGRGTSADAGVVRTKTRPKYVRALASNKAC